MHFMYEMCSLFCLVRESKIFIMELDSSFQESNQYNTAILKS